MKLAGKWWFWLGIIIILSITGLLVKNYYETGIDLGIVSITSLDCQCSTNLPCPSGTLCVYEKDDDVCGFCQKYGGGSSTPGGGTGGGGGPSKP